MTKDNIEITDKTAATAAHHMEGRNFSRTDYLLRGISPGIGKEKIENARQILAATAEKGFIYVPLQMIPHAKSLVIGAMRTVPPGLFVATKGNDTAKLFAKDNPDTKRIAFVGTRMNTSYGRKVVARRMETMQDNILVTAFGLGVSQEATIIALEKEIPVIAVMATGPGDCYPNVLRDTMQKLMDTPGCAVVTPFFPGDNVSPENFLLRNTITAMLCDETFVAQSKISGNAMDIARKTEQQGKKVYAAAGPYDDMYSTGCLQLIAEGTAQIWTPWKMQEYGEDKGLPDNES